MKQNNRESFNQMHIPGQKTRKTKSKLILALALVFALGFMTAPAFAATIPESWTIVAGSLVDTETNFEIKLKANFDNLSLASQADGTTVINLQVFNAFDNWALTAREFTVIQNGSSASLIADGGIIVHTVPSTSSIELLPVTLANINLIESGNGVFGVNGSTQDIDNPHPDEVTKDFIEYDSSDAQMRMVTWEISAVHCEGAGGSPGEPGTCGVPGAPELPLGATSLVLALLGFGALAIRKKLSK